MLPSNHSISSTSPSDPIALMIIRGLYILSSFRTHLVLQLKCLTQTSTAYSPVLSISSSSSTFSRFLFFFELRTLSLLMGFQNFFEQFTTAAPSTFVKVPLCLLNCLCIRVSGSQIIIPTIHLLAIPLLLQPLSLSSVHALIQSGQIHRESWLARGLLPNFH